MPYPRFPVYNYFYTEYDATKREEILEMSNFLYSINATLPIFLIMILGKILYRLQVINDDFVRSTDRFVFYAALPALVFKDLTENDIRSNFNFGYVSFCFFVTLIIILAIWGLTELFMKNESEKGAFIQASYRSSAAILGLAFIDNMYSSAGMAPLMIIGAVPLFNIFAVIILTLKGDNNGRKPDWKTTILNIFKNPILLGILIALPFAFTGITFPSFINKGISYVANTASPLALLSIGASFEGRRAIKKIRPTIIASFIKLFALCAIVLPLAVFFGFRNQELVGILIMVGSPATASCYIMAKNTKNDAVLTSSIIVLTTLLSSVSLTMWIYLLKTSGYL